MAKTKNSYQLVTVGERLFLAVNLLPAKLLKKYKKVVREAEKARIG